MPKSNVSRQGQVLEISQNRMPKSNVSRQEQVLEVLSGICLKPKSNVLVLKSSIFGVENGLSHNRTLKGKGGGGGRGGWLVNQQ